MGIFFEMGSDNIPICLARDTFRESIRFHLTQSLIRASAREKGVVIDKMLVDDREAVVYLSAHKGGKTSGWSSKVPMDLIKPEDTMAIGRLKVGEALIQGRT